MKRLNGKEVNEAFDNAFEVPLNLDHQPTQEEIFTLELLAVSGKAEDEIIRQVVELIDSKTWQNIEANRAMNILSAELQKELNKEAP